ncbi:MFS transporter [Pontivivens ytuae]|uniref:MFS transporter n=1 Tax=Pontivivens ytuae TaxID=2789856 RepID=A0A7S9LQ50_9RHOB|nr:MFS transporter [Pontivivens ytuae]QPH52680.1 MFS transporter [Pontivivens ytuae]
MHGSFVARRYLPRMVPTALIHRDFRIYVIGNFFALNGVWVQRITIAWLGWALTDSASFVGLLAFLMMIPTLALGPVLGVVVDRSDVRRAAIGAQIALAAVTAGLIAVYFSGALGPVLLAGFALLIGTVTALHHPVRMAMAPRLVPREAIGAAVPIISINFNLSRFLGPFIAGTLIAAFGIGAALVVNFVAFLPLLAALLVVTPRPQDGPKTEPTGFLDSFREGLAHAGADRVIRSGIAMTALAALPARGVQEILPVIADGAFARGPEGLGQLTAAAGLGALFSSAWLATHPIRPGDRLPRLSVAAAFASILLVAVLAAVPSWPAALAVLFGLGAAGTLTAVGIQSAIQIRLGDALRGRVMSLWVTTALASTAMGAILLGVLTDAVGLAPALTGTAIVALFLLILSTRLQ